MIDDIIARAHDVDEDFYAIDEKGRIQAQRIAEFIGFVDRERRIAIGKRMYECAKNAIDGKSHWFPHCQKAAERTFVYLYSNESKTERGKFLKVLVVAAQEKYEFPKVLGIATNSLDQGGRAYDFVLLERDLPENEVRKLNGIEELFNKPDQQLL